MADDVDALAGLLNRDNTSDSMCIAAAKAVLLLAAGVWDDENDPNTQREATPSDFAERIRPRYRKALARKVRHADPQSRILTLLDA